MVPDTATSVRASDIGDALRRWPLPAVDGSGDKEDRGRVVLVAGSREVPGAAVLAANAALRAGAGRVTIAAPESIAHSIALAVPESRVVALKERASGGVQTGAIDALQPFAKKTRVVLVGPGFAGDEGAWATLAAAVLALFENVPVILDAAAMDVVRAKTRFSLPVLLTPHAGEMAALTGTRKAVVEAEPAAAAHRAARKWNATVALKGAVTWIATPDGSVWRHAAEIPGLAISGSGDVLAGAIAGLAARGMPLAGAAAWGVSLHARAGERLAQRVGQLGYLARELPGEIPALVTALSVSRSEPPSSPSPPAA